MALQKLSDPMAFASGADLWLLPNAEHSHWTRKMDWYLNFQGARALSHQAPALAPGLIQLLKEEELAMPTTSAELKTPLMVSTSHRLPARYTVQLTFDGKLKNWIKQAHDVWQQMGRPATRIFLPIGESFSDGMAAWDASERSETIDGGTVSVVTDTDPQKTVGV